MLEKTLESEYIYHGKILNLKKVSVELENGKKSTREIIEHQDAVGIVPITENNEIVLVKQYRKAVDEILLEIPAGLIEEGESPRECALRELKEETGLKAKNLKDLFSIYTSPGFCTEKLYLFIARDLQKGEQELDTDEIIETVNIPIKEAFEMISEGKIKDGKTVIGLYALKGISGVNL